MNLWRSLDGAVDVVLTSADIHGAMEQIAKSGIAVHEAIYVDQLRLRFQILGRDKSRLCRLAKQRGDTIEIIHIKGLRYSLKKLAGRPVLVIGLLAIFLFSCWLPSRVLFVQVQGNNLMAGKQIIEQAKACGISFGASRREVRSEKVKNALLKAMPQLQWVGVNTYGCIAQITVHERNDLKTEQQNMGVSSIVALRDGVIGEMTVLQGNALCHTGQAVKAGQILVSGYTDCGICIRATQAKAEIYGETQRFLSAVFPAEYSHRTTISANTRKYSLIIGKKRINFFKGSGISGDTCAKIYEEKYLTLPGGFILPVALACEQSFEYDIQKETIVTGEGVLSAFAAWYLPSQMLAGEICRSSQVFFESEAFCRLDGIYDCYEIIGVARPEESTKRYE